LLTACGDNDETQLAAGATIGSEVSWRWFEQLYDVVKAETVPPPTAARIYAIAGVALHSAAVAGRNDTRSLAGKLNGLETLPQLPDGEYDAATGVNAALATTVARMFPSMSPASREAVSRVENVFSSYFRETRRGDDHERSAAYGREVAAAILEWATGDGYSRHHDCAYNPGTEAGPWAPTPPAFNARPLEPCWGDLRTMAITSPDDFEPRGHPQYSTNANSGFYKAAQEVYSAGKALTPEQKASPSTGPTVRARRARHRGTGLRSSARLLAKSGYRWRRRRGPTRS
jgi:hypothetical protein